jgi:hypothetical protein
MIVVMLIFFVTYQDANLLITDEYLELLPTVFVLAMATYGVKNTHGPGMTGSFIMLGVGFALLTNDLNDLGVIVPDILTVTLTLQRLQALIIALATIIGVAMTKD